MKVTDTPLRGVKVVNSESRYDSRGEFRRLFCTAELLPILGERQIVQINYSRTNRARVVRGMHFQYPPYAETKMIRCLRGRVWDVAVDLRANSPTFLQWYGLELAERGAQMIIIPEGFAHGFQALEADSELLYLHTAPYAPDWEAGVRHDDPLIGVDWPLPPLDVSHRDLSHPLLDEEFTGIRL